MMVTEVLAVAIAKEAKGFRVLEGHVEKLAHSCLRVKSHGHVQMPMHMQELYAVFKVSHVVQPYN